MYLTMFREPSVGGATLSQLFHGGEKLCDILEDEVREVPGQPVAEWKIKSVTAIPAGVYEITAESSQRFGPRTLTLHDVPGFDYIRIHGGNTAANTEGCLLTGVRNANGVSLTGGTSQPALSYLKGYVLAALDKGERIQIEIVPASGAQA